MGCDIHLFVERRNGEGWERAEPLVPSPYRARPMIRESVYDNRNYNLFAILANVRNRLGLAPIAMPRGLPADVSDEVRAIAEHWGMDAHNHSWLMLRELLEYDWERRNPESGLRYKTLVASFYTETLPRLQEFGSPDDIRIVFFFDN